MKKITLLLSLLFIVGMALGQMKYLPSKTIVIVLGGQNPNINYGEFSDISFYFTPELDTLYNDASSLKDASGLSNAVKLFGKNTSESKQEQVLLAYDGPNSIIYTKDLYTKTYLFDKAGIVYAKFWGARPDFVDYDNYLVKNNAQDSETFKNLLKELVKKGKTRKLGKIKKNKDYSWNPGYAPTTINVTDMEGNTKDIVELVKGNAATLFLFMHINSKFDPAPGREDGKGKEPEIYQMDVAKTMTLDKQMKVLYTIEKNIYGKKLNK